MQAALAGSLQPTPHSAAQLVKNQIQPPPPPTPRRQKDRLPAAVLIIHTLLHLLVPRGIPLTDTKPAQPKAMSTAGTDTSSQSGDLTVTVSSSSK